MGGPPWYRAGWHSSAAAVSLVPMYFRDFYHRHPHGAPLGGVILILLIVVIVVVLTNNSKD